MKLAIADGDILFGEEPRLPSHPIWIVVMPFVRIQFLPFKLETLWIDADWDKLAAGYFERSP